MAQANSNTDLSDQQWHFIGILGTGMRSLAGYAVERGVRVSGSDLQACPGLEDLVSRGINVRLSQDATRFDNGVNLVVVSPAVPDDNPELVAALEAGLEVVKLPEVLGRLMDDQPGVAVTGSHGKSTTTALIAYIMQQGGLDPSYLIGAEVPQLAGSSHSGSGPLLVAEACEYKRSFLYLAPQIGVVTNVDLEHTDYYYDLWDIQEAFCDFASQIQPDGVLVMNADDPNSKGMQKAAECKVVRYSIDSRKSQYRAERIWRAKKHTNFDLVYKGRNKGRFSIRMYGTHNVYNALAAIAGCHEAGMEFEQMREPVSEFEGAARRLELLGEPWDVAILSDFAHHPNEIRASLAATQQRFPKRRVFCVFQPHQHSRTRTMLADLAEAFDGAWLTLITDIYAARDSEEEQKAISASDLVQLMNHNGLTAHYVPEFKDLENIMVGDVVPGDVVLIMGAGDIWQVASNIVPRVEEKGRSQIAA